MYLIYVDDSGDTGLKGSLTSAFVLSALVVPDRAWLTALDDMKAFRNFLWRNFRLKQRDELKASYLIHNTGPFENLNIGDTNRMKIYKMALRLQNKIGDLETWAVVIKKDKLDPENKTPSDVREMAWQCMIERVERFTYYGKDTCVVLPDEGMPEFVRGIFRKMRRYSAVPSAIQRGEFLSRPATYIIEDPVFRRSQDSYFIQLADLNAYAAHRHVYPQSYFGSEYWDELGDVRVKAVNKLSGGPVGIKVYP